MIADSSILWQSLIKKGILQNNYKSDHDNNNRLKKTLIDWKIDSDFQEFLKLSVLLRSNK